MQSIILDSRIQGSKELAVRLITDDDPEAAHPVVVHVRVRGTTIALNRAELCALLGALEAARSNWPEQVSTEPSPPNPAA